MNRLHEGRQVHHSLAQQSRAGGIASAALRPCQFRSLRSQFSDRRYQRLTAFKPTTPCPKASALPDCATARFVNGRERRNTWRQKQLDQKWRIYLQRICADLWDKGPCLCALHNLFHSRPFVFIRGFIIFSERIGAARQRRPTGTASSVFCLDVFRHIPQEGQTRLGKDRKS